MFTLSFVFCGNYFIAIFAYIILQLNNNNDDDDDGNNDSDDDDNRHYNINIYINH